MEAGESGVGEKRKRTESNGGSSDSDLSDGWNFVDQLDINNPDVPSSDGESVEVIEAEDEIPERGIEPDGEPDAPEAASQLVSKPETPVVQVSQEEVGAAGTSGTEHSAPTRVVEAGREEMFDSSFRWFLFFATSAVLVSNLAYMATDNALDWKMEMNVETPAFLRDLPITQKLQDSLPPSMTWADKYDVTVDTLDELYANEEQADKGMARTSDNPLDDIIQFNENSKGVWKKQSLKIDNHQVRKYFEVLNEITGSAEMHNKFAQALLILDALHVGLKDLEDVVTENSELHRVLRKQKDTLFNALNEVELGVSRSMEKLATNVLNKVKKLERRFENQWCKLEKTGYKEELKGLFYECQENEEKAFEKDPKNTNDVEKRKDKPIFNEKNNKNSNEKDSKHFNERKDGQKQTVVEGYQYEVDKDSTGKVYSKQTGEGRKNGDYYKLLKSEKNIDVKQLNKQKHKRFNSADIQYIYGDSSDGNEGEFYREKNKHFNSGKGEYFSEMNQKNEKTKTESIKYGDKPSSKFSHRMKDGNPTSDKFRNEAPESKSESLPDKATFEFVTRFLKESCKNGLVSDYQSLKNKLNEKVNIPSELFSKMHDKYCKNVDNSLKQNKPTTDNFQRDVPQAKRETFTVDKSAVDIVTKYLKDNCGKSQSSNNKMAPDTYHTLKDVVNEKVKIPPETFDKMYERYCKFSDKGFKWDRNFKNDQVKGDFAGKDKERHSKRATPVIKDRKKYAESVVEITIIDESEKKDKREPNDAGKDKVILPTNKPRQWTFAYKSTSITNKTNKNGDWFIKSGESRSKTRWSHHRSDWLFDRASYRRSNPHPPNWFAGRRKNWFFRRAWARQQCRENPYDSWCERPEEETVTVPKKTSSNLS
ncbi:uncharacterized protein LOC124365735 [Homalodisca vitripennis]|uniref:uncharacterized protein LOC124365735 n=1 Tax=Homalodisca vitripennis TaxID=197043 RepID=UPI001EEACFA9|nr:uncharacterized protein LOC124365735 [Homalodisca vitripennis]